MKELLPDNAHLHRWLDMARERIQFQGLPARICWVGLGDRHRLGLAFNEMVASGELKAPIVIGRDHLDSGSVASPNRETEAMRDGSRRGLRLAAAQRAAQHRVSGATWVSLHHGGGVGMGYSQHAGMVIVADGTEAAARRLERVLWNDPATGVMRHADAGYDDRDRLRARQGPRPARHQAVTGVALLRAADRPVRAWKNGGGTTSDVVAYPPGSDLDSFDWRVSIAEVAMAGPFSCFEGIERTLVVLEGELELRFEGESSVRLVPFGEPYVFAGDAAVVGVPGLGGARDLNLMVRKGCAKAALRWLAMPWSAPADSGVLRLLVATGDVEVTVAGASYDLDRWDALIIPAGNGAMVATGAQPSLLIEVEG